MRPRTLLFAAALASTSAAAAAQGVTDAAIEGTTRSSDSAGAPVPAQIVILNRATGSRLELHSDAGGRFEAEHLTPGGPYRVEAKATGLSATRDGIMLALGQRLSIPLVLRADTVRFAEIVVKAQSPVLAPSHMGPAHTVSDSAIHKLPLLSRDFTELLQTAPEVTGTSVSGANNRMNDMRASRRRCASGPVEGRETWS